MITIDGPAAAGKSTVARRVAERLGYQYLDTGAMYRAVTYYFLQRGFQRRGFAEVEAELILRDLNLRLELNGRVLINDEEVTPFLRTLEVTSKVSAVSALASVRRRMVELQRRVAQELAKNGVDLVVEGRDMGSQVFPSARHRFYLDASAEERARRRQKQEAQGGAQESLSVWITRLMERDRQDQERAVAPLCIPQGAFVLDSTCMTEDQVVDEIVRRVRE